MAVSKPNKKFLYIEDNGDDTCTATISIPEAGIFTTMLFNIGMDQMFPMAMEATNPEYFDVMNDLVVMIPDSPEEAG